jgi:hypothetical protein
MWAWLEIHHACCSFAQEANFATIFSLALFNIDEV